MDSTVFNALQRAAEFYQQQSEKHATDRGVAWNQFNRLNVKFSRELLSDLRAVLEQQIPVLVEIRRDLGLTSNLNEYREQMTAQWNRMSTRLESVFRTLDDSQA